MWQAVEIERAFLQVPRRARFRSSTGRRAARAPVWRRYLRPPPHEFPEYEMTPYIPMAERSTARLANTQSNIDRSRLDAIDSDLICSSVFTSVSGWSLSI